MRLQRLAVLLFCLSVSAPTLAQNECARDLPTPAAASKELQAALEEWPTRKLSDILDYPGNVAEWKANIALTDSKRAKRTAQLLEQSEVQLSRDTIAGVKVHKLSPAAVAAENSDRLFLYIHGGSYVKGHGDAGILEAILIADRVAIPVLSVDYRMAPDHPHPAAINDVQAVYAQLLESMSPRSIIVGGTSAGGGLALALVHRLRMRNMPFPGAIYAGTPWADLTKTGDTMYTNECVDRVLVSYDGILGASGKLHTATTDPKSPLISPVYGDFRDFPPTMLTSGTRDLFLSDVVRTHRKLRQSGAVADLHVYEGMSHAGYLVSPDTPESQDMYRELKLFVEEHLD